MTEVSLPPQYPELAKQEAEFWGGVKPRADNPQLWDDPMLFDIFLRNDWETVIDRVVKIGGRVIDIGCGEGNLSIILAKKGMAVCGLDISEERIYRARHKSNRTQEDNVYIRPEFIVCDLNKTSYQGDPVDVVVAHDSLHHILNLDFAVKQIYSALKPGGFFIVYDYVGMGIVRRFFSACFYAVLPTYKSYRDKLKLSRRLLQFFSSERRKRKRLEQSPSLSLYKNESPFEEISQKSIFETIRKYFSIITKTEHHAFFFYLAPKLRIPQRWKSKFARLFARMDNILLRCNLCKGAYIMLIARKDVG